MASSASPSTTPADALPSSTTTTSTSLEPSILPPPTSMPTADDGTSLSYPPMTTPWSTPLSCTWTYNIDDQPQPGASGAVAWLDLEPVSGASTLSCYPDGMFSNDRTGVFSPGTCPGGWTTVMVQRRPEEDDDTATTTAVCCSSEYSLEDGQCRRSIPTVLAVPITYNETASTYEVLTNSTTTLYSATIAVYTIRALFREEDKELLGLSDEDDISGDKKSTGLSLSARVGIGIGVAMLVLIAISAGLLLFLRKRDSRCQLRKRKSLGSRSPGSADDVHDADMVYGRGVIPLAPRRRSDEAEPPPAYETAATRHSSVGQDSGGEDARDGEIEVLRAQKEAIQRRIDELQSEDPETEPGRS